MTREIFQAFVKHASGRADMPNDYQSTKLAMLKMFPKLAAFAPGKNPGCMHGGGRVVQKDLWRAMSHLSVEKKASDGMLAHGVELAGLGVLARPSINHLRGKEMSERSKALHETAGLGILAAPSAYAMGKHFLTRH